MIFRHLRLLLALSCLFLSHQFLRANSLNFHWNEYTVSKTQFVSLGDVKKFYRFPTYHKSGKNLTLRNAIVKIELKANSSECFINGIKFILTKPITQHSTRFLISKTDLEKLINPILHPVNKTGANNFNTVIIDVGHGGKDPGAVNKYATESYYNLQIAKRLQYHLKKAGYAVVMTRSNNHFLSLTERVKYANKYKNAIFVSIHFNAEGTKRARGIETFTLSPKGVPHYGRNSKSSDHKTLVGNYQDSQNIALATAVHGSILQSIYGNGTRYDRGIRRARYSVLTTVKHPAILIEGGFLSHPEEAKLIHSKAYLDNLSIGIYKGIRKYQYAMKNAYKRHSTTTQ